MSSPSRPRVVLINNAPAPFRFGLFRHLQEAFRARGIDFRVLFWNVRPLHRPYYAGLVEKEPFRWEDAGCRSVLVGDYQFVLPWGIGAALRRLKPEVVISTGCAGPSYAALRWARGGGGAGRAKFVLWWGGTERHTTRPYQHWTHRHFCARADAFVAYGSEARDYLVTHGAAADRIQIGLNMRDVRGFAEQVATLRANADAPLPDADAALWRDIRAASEGRANLVCITRIEPAKNVALLPRLVRELRASRPVRLHVVGDGTARADLERAIADANLTDAIRFWGAVKPDQVALFHVLADLALAPSFRETWGFSIVEAMAAGVPVLASAQAACTRDIVDHGATGFVLDPNADAPWIETANRLLADDDARRRVGAAAADFAARELTFERSGRGFLAAVEQVLT